MIGRQEFVPHSVADLVLTTSFSYCTFVTFVGSAFIFEVHLPRGTLYPGKEYPKIQFVSFV